MTSPFKTCLALICLFAMTNSGCGTCQAEGQRLPQAVLDAAASVGTQTVVFLYGDSLCGSCVGDDVIAQSPQPVLYLHPYERTNDEVDTLVNAIGLAGDTYFAEADVDVFLERLGRCMLAKNWRSNLWVHFDEDGRITKTHAL